MSTPDRLLTAEEVARRLSVKPATVYDAAANGRLPVVRLWGGRRRSLLRFQSADIERLIQDRTEPAKGAAARSG